MIRLFLNMIAGVSLLLCLATAVLLYRGIHAGHGDSLTIALFRSGPSQTIYGPSYDEQQVTLGIDQDTFYINQTGFPLGPKPTDATPTFMSRFWYFDYADEFIRPAWPMRHINAGNPNYNTVEHFRLKYIFWRNVQLANHGYYFVGPLWMLIAVFSVLPALVALRIAFWRRRKRVGKCAMCGYDLRATPERCPECGTVAVM